MQRRDRYLELPFGDVGSSSKAQPTRASQPARAEPEDGDQPARAEPPAGEAAVLSVGELDRQLRRLIEGATEDVRVEGEISNLKVVSSGHAYFTLKDEHEEACLDCVMYRTAPPRSKRLLADGAKVILVGKATVYIPRGRLQLIADSALPVGRGAHLLALERLKAKLEAEGLFNPERRRALPADPRVIGVVTSADGAAIHDIITVAFRRGGVRIVLAPAPVQGPTAAHRMAQAILLLERVPGVEAIIVGRGGGSADDLSAYNDEELVRQVAATRVPIVSAVGHEIDTTLTDLAADARAATPSQAAEMLVPDAGARLAGLDHLRSRMRRALHHRLQGDRALLERQRAALGSPERMIDERRQEIDEALARIQGQVGRLLSRRRGEVARLERGLTAHHPSAVIARARVSIGPFTVRVDASMRRLLVARGRLAGGDVARFGAAMRRRLEVVRRRLANDEARLGAAMRRRLEVLRRRLANDAARLDALSPLAVLARGYAIAIGPSGRAVRAAREVAAGDRLTVRLHEGALDVEVLAVLPDGSAATNSAGAPGNEGGVDVPGPSVPSSPGERNETPAPTPGRRRKK